MEESTQQSGATDKLLLVIEALDELGSAGVTELADYLSLPKSTIHYHLDVLSENGFVVRDGGNYKLGLRFLEIGEHTRQQIQVYEIAKPEIEKLAERTDELALLMIEQRGLGVYVHKAKGENAIDLDAPIGRHAHLHNRAMGKAILAYLSEERVEQIVDRYGLPTTTQHTIGDKAELFDELAEIRDRGISFNEQESVDGLRGISVPILDSDGVTAAISIAGPVARLGDQEIESEFVDLLNRSRNVVELSLQNQ